MAHFSRPAGVLRSRTHAVFGCILLHAAGRHADLRIPAVGSVTGYYTGKRSKIGTGKAGDKLIMKNLVSQVGQELRILR